MKEGLSRTDLMDWFHRVDNGNYHSISCGERIHGPTLDMRVILSAAAAITTKVEITPTLSLHWIGKLVLVEIGEHRDIIYPRWGKPPKSGNI